MQNNRKGIAFALRSLCLLSALLVLFVPLAAAAQVTPVVSEQDDTLRGGLVRVCLASLDGATSLDVQLSAAYRVYNSELALPANENITIGLDATGGNITLAYGDQRWIVGPETILLRSSKQATITITQAKGASAYPADLYLSSVETDKGYALMLVANIQVEDYITGVLSYAIMDTSPEEALKAQAVAARTYTLRAMEERANEKYDVVDTGADQLYRGTPQDNTACRTAVYNTAGCVLKYGDEFAKAYTCFSNGGQTESSENVWGESYPYLPMKEDPFDLASKSAVAKTIRIDKDLLNGSVPEAFLSLRRQTAIDALIADGYAANTGNTSLIWLESIKLNTPKYAPPSKLYTAAELALMAETQTADGSRRVVPVTVTAQIFDELEAMLDMSLQPDNNELWSVSAGGDTFTVRAARHGHGVGMSLFGAIEMAKQGYSYESILGFYYPGCRNVKLNLSFALMREAIEMSLTSEPTLRPITTPRPSETAVSPETAAPEETTGANPLPSEPEQQPTEAPTAEPEQQPTEAPTADPEQQPTEAPTAEPEQQPTEAPTAEPKQQPTEAPTSEPVQQPTAVPTADPVVPTPQLLSATPAPTPMAEPTAEQAAYAFVIANDFLNLRQAPSKQAPIVMVVLEGDAVQVLSVEGAWAHVSYNGVEAYAVRGLLGRIFMDSPLVEPAATPGASPVATTAPEASAGYSATVYAKSGTVNFREQPYKGSAIIMRLQPGTQVVVTGTVNDFSVVEYMGIPGYIMTEFLRFGGEAPAVVATMVPVATPVVTPVPTPVVTPVPTQSPAPVQSTVAEAVPGCGEPLVAAAEYRNARVTTNGGSLNLRQAPNNTAPILKRIPQCSVVLAQELDDIWCSVRYDGVTGYAKRSFLTFGENYAAETITGQMSVLLPEYSMGPATVVTPSGSLNLRQKACPYSVVLSLVPSGATVEVYTIEDGWALVTYREFIGYVSVAYLDLQPEISLAAWRESDALLPDGFQEAQGMTAAVSANGAALRLSPTADAQLLASLPAGTELPVLATGEAWCIVAWQNQTGYLLLADAQLLTE